MEAGIGATAVASWVGAHDRLIDQILKEASDRLTLGVSYNESDMVRFVVV